MEFFLKDIFEKGASENAHPYFVRFGKGKYERRFLIKLNKGKKIKIKGSFELANAFVDFVKDNKDLKFSGNFLAKEKIPGKEGKKKTGGFVYEISESSLEGFEDSYYYLLDAVSEDIVLKIKKKLPKPGKAADKIDDKFCSLELDEKYWDKVKEVFFWDVQNIVKKVSAEHELNITEIILPEGESDPVNVREFAKRKGKIIRKINVDGKEETKSVEFKV